MWQEIVAELACVAASYHEANGVIECSNRTLRSFYHRISAVDAKSSVADVLSEASFEKNIYKESKLDSSYELIYSRKPRIIDYYQVSWPAVTIA